VTDLERIESKLDRILALLEPKKSEPRMIAVNSSHLAQIGWQYGNLYVAFQNGSRYRFVGVPETVFKDFLDARSYGEYFHRNIEGQWPSEKMMTSTTSASAPSST
jgi:hypothetical protein